MPPKGETFTFNQMKEIIQQHEESMLKFFNTTVDRLEKKVSTLTEENYNIKKELESIKESLHFHSEIVDEKIGKICNDKSARNNDNIVLDKLAELEDRSRRNNLRFNGIREEEGEDWQKTEAILKKVLTEKLDVKDVMIERVHRTGRNRRPDGTINHKRTIIAKFLNYKDKVHILEQFQKKKLWEKSIFINEDFSERTSQLRKNLFKKAKDLRAAGKQVKVVYNKLIFKNSENSLKDVYQN